MEPHTCTFTHKQDSAALFIVNAVEREAQGHYNGHNPLNTKFNKHSRRRSLSIVKRIETKA